MGPVYRRGARNANLRYERGDLIVHSPAKRLHQEEVGFLTYLLRGFCSRRGLGCLYNGPSVLRICQTSLSASGSTGATQYTIGIVVSNYYTRNHSGGDTVINVAQPITANFITGGGFLVNTNASNGQYPGTVGKRTNFGFNVKYNKSGTNLQGNMNIIDRSGGSVYQIKGNSMTSLGVQYCQTDSSGSIIPALCKAAPVSPCTTTATATCPIRANFNGRQGEYPGHHQSCPGDLDRRERDASGQHDRQG
jgi:hypothetical protein